jgi:hypothetical protein
MSHPRIYFLGDEELSGKASQLDLYTGSGAVGFGSHLGN